MKIPRIAVLNGIVLASMIVIVLRVCLPSHGLNKADIFKDAAHLFVGGLVGAWLIGWWSNDSETEDTAKLCLVLSLILSGVEVAAALIK